MGKFKKLIFTILVGLVGFLLTLTGLSLIQLSQNLILYSGIVLLILAGLLYFLL